MSRQDAIKLMQDAGVTPGTYFGGVTNANTLKTPQKQQGFSFGNFATNVGKSVAGIAGGAAQSFIGGLAKSFQDTSKGIVQAVQTNQNLGAFNARAAASKALMDKYSRDFKAGKISKQRYNALLKGIQKESEAGSKEIGGYLDEAVAPADFIKGAATIGSLPFAAGKLQGTGIPSWMPGAARAEQLAMKIPSVAKSASTVQPSIVRALATMPFKQALITGPNAQVGAELATAATNQIAGLDTTANNLKKAGAAAGWLAVPAAASLATTAFKSAKGAVKKGIFDSSGLFDNIKLKDGKSVLEHLDDVAKSDSVKAKQYEDILRVAQDNISKQYKGDARLAAEAIGEYIQGKNLAKMSLGQFATELNALAQSTIKFQKKANAVIKSGKEIVDASGRAISKDQLGRIGAVKSTQKEVNSLAKLVRESKSSDELQAKLSQWIVDNDRFASNAQNKRVLEQLIESRMTGPLGEEMVRNGLQGTNQVFIKTASGKLKPVLGENGYYMGLRNRDAAQFAEKVGQTAMLDRGNQARFGKIGELIRKTGLSPESATEGQSKAVFRQVKDNFVKKIDELNIVRPMEGGDQRLAGQSIFEALTKYSENHRTITDLRQLTAKEAASVLGVSKSDAKKILRAYKDSFKGLSLADRGLAGKIQDFNLRVNPIAAPYSRVQAAGRYAGNPFFMLQEGIETRTGVAALTGKTPQFGKDYSRTINTLEKAGILNNTGFGAEGADVTFGTITSHLMKNQERSIAAGVEALAEKQGKTVTSFLADPKNADLIQDLKTIVQYPDKGFTSSNLAKMMNLVVFPSRYNLKVTQFAAKQLMKQPAAVQLGVIKSINDFDNFLNSEEGIKWQSKNHELIGIVNYFSPTYPITQVLNLLKGRGRNVGDFGSLGGLPFGIVSQVLQGQGVIPQLNGPYINPKTGEVMPEKIPETVKARAFKMVSDIIGTMYNYPGRLVGLPSKRQANEVIPGAIMGTPKSSEFRELPTPKLSPEEQKKSDTLKSLAAPTANTSLRLPTNTPTTNLANFKRTNPQYRPYTPKPSSGRGKKAKKKAIPIGQPF